jgi:hypothetical protein
MGRKGSNAAPKEVDAVKAFDLLTEALYVLQKTPRSDEHRSVHEDWSGPLETRIAKFLADPWRNPNPKAHGGPKAKA